MTYKVLEKDDKTYLFILEDGKALYARDDYKGIPGQLARDVMAVWDNKPEIAKWKTKVDDPEKAYTDLLESGYKVVADENGVCPEEMSRTSLIEFAYLYFHMEEVHRKTADSFMKDAKDLIGRVK